MTMNQKNILRALNTQRRRAIENTAHQLPMENYELQSILNQCHPERSAEGAKSKDPAREQ